MNDSLEVARIVTLVGSNCTCKSPQISHYRRLTSALTTDSFIPLLVLCSTNILKKDDIQQLRRLHNVRFQSTSQGAIAIQHRELRVRRMCLKQIESAHESMCVFVQPLSFWPSVSMWEDDSVSRWITPGEHAVTHMCTGLLRLACREDGMQHLHPIYSS